MLDEQILNTARPVEIGGLRCEYLNAPLCIGENHPRLSWELISQRPETGQRMSRVQVFEYGDNPETTVLWDSGRVDSKDPWIMYKGPRREIGRKILWRVKVWCDNVESEWSAPATWEWGPVATEDWLGSLWIKANYDDLPRPYPAAYLRRSFHMLGEVDYARMYFSGLGSSEVWLNGSRVEEVLLDPAQSDYEKFAYYRTYDVTSFIQRGGNQIDVTLGDGWFNQDRVWSTEVHGGCKSYGDPGLKLLLQIKNLSGELQCIITDSQWLCTLDGPIRSNNVYAGEIYDARLELGACPGENAVPAKWKPVRAGEECSPKLVPQLIPAIRKKCVLPPVAFQSPLPGVWIYDFGQNIVGICSLHVNAPRGTEICLRFAESIACDGTIDPLSTGYLNTGVIQTDRYVCRGGGEETWEPRFTYHGFRYVELTGYPGTPSRSVLNAITASTNLARVGTFSCSDDLINRLQETALRTITGNLHGVISDCPTRERCGWLGDSHLVAEALIFNFDAANFLRKYQGDILGSLGASDNPCGGYPVDPRVPTNIAPGKRRCQQGRPDWASALILIPWYLYLYYGDTRTMSESFSAMHDLMAFWDEVAIEGVLEDGFGDWCPPGTSPESKACPAALTSTAYWYQTAGCMRKFASFLGRPAEAIHYARLQRKIRRVFLDRFFVPSDNGFGSQTGDVVALAFGLVARNHRQDLAQRLARRIREEGKGHFDTGIHGLKHIFDVLAQHGQADACMDLLHKEGFPGFEHLFSLGATTFWEMMYDPEQFPLGEERSKNHPMQAAFATWHYHGLGGLRPDPNHPGFEHFFLTPQLVGNLMYAEIVYESIRGRIVSKWSVHDGVYRWEVEIPANASATLRFPKNIVANSLQETYSAGKACKNTLLAKPRGMEWKLGSGCYQFQSQFHRA